MDTVTYSSARANLASTMNRVCNDHEPLIITRGREKSVVMLSLEDYQSLEETSYLLRSPANAQHDRKMVVRINKLIRETQRDPFAGIGKPEPLKHALCGFWSRRITGEHRMVYRIEDDDVLLLAQLRYHY
jgi:toxin YoeB